MANVRRFAGVNTKIRVLKGKMLKKSDYESLITKRSVKDVAEYLKNNTDYNKVLKDVDIAKIHRGDLEVLFKKYIVINFEKILHYFTGEYRVLFRILFIRYEIEDLKLYIRGLVRGEGLELARKYVIYSGVYSTINHDSLVTSKTIEGFIDNLKGTIYYDILKPFADEERSKVTFYMEMALDRFYFRKIYETIKKLDKRDQLILAELFGKNVDLLNLEWIHRGLKHYNLSPEELINYTLSGGYSLKYKDIKDLCYSKDDDELINRMLDSRYGFLFDNKETLDLFMERRIERYLFFQFIYYYRKSHMNIVSSIAYMHLVEYEMRDIISITEAIRYDLDKDDVKKYLIRRLEGSDR